MSRFFPRLSLPAWGVALFLIALTVQLGVLSQSGVDRPPASSSELQVHWSALVWLQDGPAAAWNGAASLGRLDVAYVGTVYSLFGPRVAHVRLAQALFGALAVVLCLLWGRRLARGWGKDRGDGDRIPLAAAGATALLPLGFGVPSSVSAAPLLVVLALVLVLALRESGSLGVRRFIESFVLVALLTAPFWSQPPSWSLLWLAAPLWMPYLFLGGAAAWTSFRTALSRSPQRLQEV